MLSEAWGLGDLESLLSKAFTTLSCLLIKHDIHLREDIFVKTQPAKGGKFVLPKNKILSSSCLKLLSKHHRLHLGFENDVLTQVKLMVLDQKA